MVRCISACKASEMASTMFYPFEARRDIDGLWQIRFPDIPEAAITVKVQSEVRRHAVAALEAAFYGYLETRRPVPSPSPPRLGQDTIAVAPGIASRVTKHNEALLQRAL